MDELLDEERIVLVPGGKEQELPVGEIGLERFDPCVLLRLCRSSPHHAAIIIYFRDKTPIPAQIAF